MRFLSWIIAVPVTIVIIAFAIANRGSVIIFFDPLPYQLDIAIWIVVIGAVIFGFIVGALIRWMFDYKWRARAKQGRKRTRALEQEIAGLRNQISNIQVKKNEIIKN